MAGWVLLETFMNRWRTLPMVTADIRGRTVIVTGANVGGLGSAAAKYFYGMGPARLILTARTLSKGEEVKEEIMKMSREDDVPETKIEVWKLDLGDFESVKAFGRKAEKELDRIDILVCNAGVSHMSWDSTKDGWELHLQTNVISTFLLSALLVPLLSRTARLPQPGGTTLRPHLVIVTSDLHQLARFPHHNAPNIFEALNTKEQSSPSNHYCISKLLDILLTRQLAKSPAVDAGVVVCTANPGFSRSELLREMPIWFRKIWVGLMARTTEEGAKNYLYAALTDDISPGAYISSCQITPLWGLAASEEGAQLQERTWAELADIVTKIAPETKEVWATSA